MDGSLRTDSAMPGMILASGSPRRRELLFSLGWQFRIVVPEIDESIAEEGPREAAERLALKKAKAVAVDFPEHLVIAADTIVVIDGQILGKPKDDCHALEMLHLLNNRTHEVITGLAMCLGEKVALSSEVTEVTFRKMEHSHLKAYVSTGEGVDKAGAYAIQGKGSLLVRRISGCYFNVVGLPLFRMSRMLQDLGMDLPVQWR